MKWLSRLFSGPTTEQRAVEPTGWDGSAEMKRAMAHYGAGRFEAALQDFEKASQGLQSNKEVWAAKATCLLELGRVGLAQEVLDLMAGEPDATYFVLRSWAALQDKEFDKALALADLAIEANLRLSGAWNNRGWALVNLGRYEEATLALARALELEPEFDKARFNQAVTLIELGRFSGAQEILNSLLGKAIWQGSCHWQLARIALLEQRNDALVAHLQRAAKENAFKVPSLVHLHGIYAESGRHAAAVDLEREIQAAGGEPKVLHLIRAQNAFAAGDRDASLHELDGALELDPGYQAAAIDKMRVLVCQGQMDLALECRGRLLEHTGGKECSPAFEAQLLAEVGKQAEADALAGALHKRCNTASSFGLLCLMANYRGEAELAASLGSQALARCPTMPSYHRCLMTALLRAGRADRALEVVTAAQQQVTWDTNWGVDRALALSAIGRKAEALTLLDQEISSRGKKRPGVDFADGAEFAFHGAMCHALRTPLGGTPEIDKARALEFLAEAVKLGMWNLRYFWHFPAFEPLFDASRFKEILARNATS